MNHRCTFNRPFPPPSEPFPPRLAHFRVRSQIHLVLPQIQTHNEKTLKSIGQSKPLPTLLHPSRQAQVLNEYSPFLCPPPIC